MKCVCGRPVEEEKVELDDDGTGRNIYSHEVTHTACKLYKFYVQVC
jgi:hypothetical protein